MAKTKTPLPIIETRNYRGYTIQIAMSSIGGYWARVYNGEKWHKAFYSGGKFTAGEAAMNYIDAHTGGYPFVP